MHIHKAFSAFSFETKVSLFSNIYRTLALGVRCAASQVHRFNRAWQTMAIKTTQKCLSILYTIQMVVIGILQPSRLQKKRQKRKERFELV
jgi:hypothetical protein